MKEDETVKEFVDKLSKVATQIRLLGEQLSDERVVEKILVCLPEMFETKISSLEENKNFSEISVAELVNALQATKQRRSLRMEGTTKGALMAHTKSKTQSHNRFGKKPIFEEKEEGSNGRRWKNNFPPCRHCKKNNHTKIFCWFRPNVKCRACNQLGHVEKVCKNKADQQEEKRA